MLLFTLILIVCALFVANAAGAAVRARRTELGVLACLGWRGGKLFAAVLYLNIRERGAELAALRTLGWRERTLGRLITLEGAGMGLAGSVPGAAAGLVAAAVFTGSLPPQLFTAAITGVIAGTLIATLAAVLPASLLGRTATAQALAEE